MEKDGVGTHDEYIFSTPYKWANQDCELHHPTIPKEPCCHGKIRLSGSPRYNKS
jgi:hypothetical protein